jgi:hypothetical protein
MNDIAFAQGGMAHQTGVMMQDAPFAHFTIGPNKAVGAYFRGGVDACGGVKKGGGVNQGSRRESGSHGDLLFVGGLFFSIHQKERRQKCNCLVKKIDFNT